MIPLGAHDLTDPAFWAAGNPHELVDDLRGQGAVQRHESAAEGPLWAVLTHREALEVLGDAQTFSSRGGSLLGTGQSPPAGSGRMMALTDPPRHRGYREPVAPFFTTRYASGLRGRLRELTERVVRRALEHEEIDFVREIGAKVPLTIMCDLMDIPDQDRDMVVGLCDRAFLGVTPAERRAAHQALLPYLLQLALARRDTPGADLVSAFAATLDLDEVVLNADNIIVGGIQTVRHTAAMATLTLMERPGAWRALGECADLTRATDELLRWTSVGLHVLRTATRDVELGGQKVREGDRVVVWTPAANRDASVFDRPHRLDLERHPNRHLAFGWGTHYCIGGPLARAELRELFGALSRLVAEIEPLGAYRHNQSIINFGLDSFPVRLRPR
ncbi:cytochrome P450 [Nonomuraea sp. NPDC050547]|uniref:cytochrome P450 n=1 Tax=unclassified Nonomuraea TaxID=2593643 RepID=UPI00378B69AA